jgi:hypothetical protein
MGERMGRHYGPWCVVVELTFPSSLLEPHEVSLFMVCTDLIECAVVEVEASMTVEDACDVIRPSMTHLSERR